jgi:hypothetical protein
MSRYTYVPLPLYDALGNILPQVGDLKEGTPVVELSSVEIAVWFHKSERTIQRWIKQGKLKVQSVGYNRYLLDELELEHFKRPIATGDLEVFEYRLKEMERRIEALEHRSPTAAEPAGKKEQKKTKKKSTKRDGYDANQSNHLDDLAAHSLHR